MKEYWDLYDRDRRPLGKTHPRGVPLPEGSCFLAVEVWTFNSAGKLLLTLRSEEKENYPNLWECTGGAVVAGETSLQGALRELSEETGISVRPEELRLLGTQCRTTSFMDTYLLRKDVPLEEIVLQKGETSDARWVSRSELSEMARQGEIVGPLVERLKSRRQELETLLKDTD